MPSFADEQIARFQASRAKASAGTDATTQSASQLDMNEPESQIARYFSKAKKAAQAAAPVERVKVGGTFTVPKGEAYTHIKNMVPGLLNIEVATVESSTCTNPFFVNEDGVKAEGFYESILAFCPEGTLYIGDGDASKQEKMAEWFHFAQAVISQERLKPNERREYAEKIDAAIGSGGYLVDNFISATDYAVWNAMRRVMRESEYASVQDLHNFIRWFDWMQECPTLATTGKVPVCLNNIFIRHQNTHANA